MSSHQSILPKGRSFTASTGIQAAVLPKGRSSTQTQEPGCSFTRDWMGAVASRCFLHRAVSLASEQTLKDLWRSQGQPTWRWGEWIWLTGPSGLHRNSPQGLNISSNRILTRTEIRKCQSPCAPYWIKIYNKSTKFDKNRYSHFLRNYFFIFFLMWTSLNCKGRWRT